VLTEELPSDAIVFRAIEIYLSQAYGPGMPPKGVLAQLEQLKGMAKGELLASPAVEHDVKDVRRRHLIRLGNRFYPNMKLCVEERPDGRGWLFRADTHDRHVRPPEGSKDAEWFKDVVGQNAVLSQAIEGAWAREGIPTFRTYLKEDLARRAELAKKGVQA
jgi:hypothetical protein